MLPHVLRSGTVAESAGSDSAGTAERRYPMSEVSGGGWDALEKEMATHSSVLAWRIPGTGEPGGLLSMGSYRVRHD